MSDFDFFENDESTKIELDYVAEAAGRNCHPIKVRIEYDVNDNIHYNKKAWGNPDLTFLERSTFCAKKDLIDNEDNILTNLALDIAKKIQFPESTAYFHGIGIVAAAMTKNFQYQLGDRCNPCNLYAVSSQPPGSGKSGVHWYYFQPFAAEVETLNKSVEKSIKQKEKQGNKLKQQIKEAKNNPNEMFDLINSFEKLEGEIEQMTTYKPALTNATPAAAEEQAAVQGGFFNIASDEAEAVNVLLGGTYANDGKCDYEIFLKGFENGYFSSSRVSRSGYNGNVRSSFVVIAQDDAVLQLIKVAATGRGVFDRILIFQEPSNVGNRTYSVESMNDSINETNYSEYKSMMKELVHGDPKTLVFDDEARKTILSIKSQFEPFLKRGEKYGSDMWRGTVSKAEYQICKISCVLFAVDNIRYKKGFNVSIGSRYVEKAAKIYKKILDQMYEQINNMTGVTGDDEVTAFYEWAKAKFDKEKRVKLDINVVIKGIRNKVAFKQMKGDWKTYFSESLAPKLEHANIIVFHRGFVYLNPNINNLG